VVALAIAASSSRLPVDGAAQPENASIIEAKGCELHIWPASTLSSLGEGAWLNHVEGQALRTAKVPLGPLLTSEQQINLISSMNTADVMGRTNYLLVVHVEPAPHRLISAPHLRRTTSRAQCYAELSIEKIFYHYSPLMKSEIRTLVTFDEFGAGPEALSTFSSWGTASLTAFPPKTPDDRETAISNLNAAFLDSIIAFAGHMRDAQATNERSNKSSKH
jgi:hypothetical protein